MNTYKLIFHTFKSIHPAYVVLDNFTTPIFFDSETKILLSLIFKTICKIISISRIVQNFLSAKEISVSLVSSMKIFQTTELIEIADTI